MIMRQFSKNNNSSKKATMQSTTTYSDNILGKIRERAYFIWESKNRPDNTSIQDWLEAEKQLKKLKII